MDNTETASRSAAPLTPLTLSSLEGHDFIVPVKKINEGDDVSTFHRTSAYIQLMTFLFQLNAACFPRKRNAGLPEAFVETWEISSIDAELSKSVRSLRLLLGELGDLIVEAPPSQESQRFGNISFRTWYKLAEAKADDLLQKYLPQRMWQRGSDTGRVTAADEIKAYLLGSFGSAQRLDYGSGHELSFLAFLVCLWKLGIFEASSDGEQERSIVLAVIEPYLELIRRLILTYNLEPAGSHGVWGLDDHSFLPYIFGSAQLSPAIVRREDIQLEGSRSDAPRVEDIPSRAVVASQRKSNMFFSAIGFIYDVKKGPFAEHSPILYDISGIKFGWAKVNKGMLKMYNVEVLGKFPVIQHFPFGSLLPWEVVDGLPEQPRAGRPGVPVNCAPSATLHLGASGSVSSRGPGAGDRQPARYPSPNVELTVGSGTMAPWAVRPSGPSTLARSADARSSAMPAPLGNPQAATRTEGRGSSREQNMSLPR